MGKGPKRGFSFPKSAGFSGSTGKVKHVAGYTRSVPKRMAKGGAVEMPKVPKGGPPKLHAMREVANKALRRHIEAKPPAGHGVKPK